MQFGAAIWGRELPHVLQHLLATSIPHHAQIGIANANAFILV
jgi:hypothetical protein